MHRKGEVKMQVKKEINGSEMTAGISGRIDINSSPVLAAELENIPEEISTVVLDFSELNYVSSAGLRVIFQLHKRMKERGGNMIIRHVNDFVLEILDSIGFLDVFTVEKQED